MALNAGPVTTFGPDDRMEPPATITGVLIVTGPYGLALAFEGDRPARYVAIPLSDWPEFRVRIERLIAESRGES